MGLLAQQALGFQGFAVGARLGVQLDADEEATATDFFDMGVLQGLELLQEAVAQGLGAGDQALVHDDLERSPGDGTGQGVTTEGTAMIAGVEDGHDGPGGQHRRNRVEAAGEGFADDDDVGGDAFVLEGKELAGTAQAGLNLVHDQENVVGLADVLGRLQVAVRGHQDTGFALDGFDHKGTGVGGDGLLQGLDVAKGHDFEAGREGPEAIFILGLGGAADDGGGAAVEVVFADDDFGLVLGDALDLVAPLAGGLNGGFHGFGAGVHGQHGLGSGQLGQFLIKEGQLTVAKGPGGQGHFVGLILEGLDNFGVTVALVDGGVGA